MADQENYTNKVKKLCSIIKNSASRIVVIQNIEEINDILKSSLEANSPLNVEEVRAHLKSACKNHPVIGEISFS